jgi:coatomer protein complex subunit gamma
LSPDSGSQFFSGQEQVHVFKGVDKAHVIQEARIFNDTHVDTARCIQVMTKLLYLLGKGDNFSSKESTESIFFPMTKLFQSKDVSTF